MDDVPSRSRTNWFSKWRIGSQHYPATFLALFLATASAALLTPVFSFILGSGPLVFWVICALVFTVLLLFKKIIFHNVYHHTADDGDAALLEYLVQHNVSGTPGEEEVETELLDNALHLKEVKVHECMTPRVDVVHLDADASVEALRQLFIESGFSRILISEEGDLDRILGYVHVQQIFGQPVNTIREWVLPAESVPESSHVNELLNRFVRDHASIACVVDEFGSLSGIVTLEDTLEQLFGDIDDEHDLDVFIEQRLSEREFRFSGRLDVDDLNAKYPELNLPSGDYNTLSGMVVTEAQILPEQGLSVLIGDHTFYLEQVSDRKIEVIRITLGDAAEA